MGNHNVLYGLCNNINVGFCLRYEKLPLDFRTPFVFNMEIFPQPSNSSGPLSIAASRTASSTLASLSRYFLHQRWVWGVHSSQVSAVAMQAIAHILSMLSEWVCILSNLCLCEIVYLFNCGNVCYVIWEVLGKRELKTLQTSTASGPSTDLCRLSCLWSDMKS